MDSILFILIIAVLVAAGWYAKIYFTRLMPKKDEKDLWKKQAQNVNKQLEDALAKKKEDDYKSFLHQKVSRYQPKLPHRVEGLNEVMKWVKNEMEMPSGPTSIVQAGAELYDGKTVVLTFNYMTQTKVGDKFTEGAGKVTRVWVHGRDGWKLVHEHVSSG
jgi:ketosteroid isomerase-like protein